MKKKALNSYVMYFLNTDIGIDYRKSLETGNAIRTISKTLIHELNIFLPELKKQKDLAEASLHIEKQIKELNSLKTNLAHNPNLVQEIDTTTRGIPSVTDEDKILDMINNDESKTREFKKTFAYNSHTNDRKDDKLIEAAVKSIVGFINANGGKIFIGVHDSKEIIGLEEEIKRHGSLDKFKLFFSDVVEKRIGPIFNTHFDFKIHEVLNKKILVADCRQSLDEDTHCFYMGKHYYVRQNPKTILLQGEDLMKYLKARAKRLKKL